MKAIKVKYRKLGKEQADGIAYTKSRIIEIDERLEGHDHLSVIIHEMTHILQPHLDEDYVAMIEKEMMKVLRKEGVWIKKKIK